MSSSAQRALEYLEQLPGTTFTKLYQQPSTALAIFRRMLPHLAKTIVMAMLYLPHPFAASELDAWVKPDHHSTQVKERALSILQRLKIVYEEQYKGRQAFRLSPAFGKSLRMALTGGGKHSSFGVPCSEPDKTPVTAEYLDTFARKQWEAILYYVVGSASAGLGAGIEISTGTRTLLEKGRFVVVRGRSRAITQDGFTFLLQDVNAQIWSLLIVYLEVSADLHMDSVDVLSFLFTLGSLELGISYSTSNLTPTQLQMLEDLTDFGLVYRRSPNSDRYYPTRLATTLTSEAPALPNNSFAATTTDPNDPASTASEKGYIILETNYRLYAYTSSPLPISILSLFANLHTRYPNLVTAKITKPSIQTAIASGITSDQIISYLQNHAHPILRRQAALHSAPILPPTVVDQIRLWQIEGERMKSTKGFLIRDVGTDDDYTKAVQYAEALGILVKEFPHKKSFFVTRMEQMSTYFKSQAARKREAKEAAAAGKS
ncbi:RNA polymerase II transcription factor B subunit 2 [Cercospora zeina]